MTASRQVVTWTTQMMNKNGKPRGHMCLPTTRHDMATHFIEENDAINLEITGQYNGIQYTHHISILEKYNKTEYIHILIAITN